jgi:phosphomethylpyrimidine synthase
MARARADFRWFDQFALSLDPQNAYEVWRAQMPEKCADAHDVRYCSMCGPRFCPIRMNRTLQERFGKNAEKSFS